MTGPLHDHPQTRSEAVLSALSKWVSGVGDWVRDNTTTLLCHPDDYERVAAVLSELDVALVRAQVDEFGVVAAGTVLAFRPDGPRSGQQFPERPHPDDPPKLKKGSTLRADELNPLVVPASLLGPTVCQSCNEGYCTFHNYDGPAR